MKVLLTISLLLSVLLVSSQTNSKSSNNSSFSDIILLDDTLCALTHNGQLHRWDLVLQEKIETLMDTTIAFSSMGTDIRGNIYLATIDGKVFSFINDELELKYSTDRKHINAIVFNSSNEMFLVCTNGVYFPEKDKLWNRFRHYNDQIVVRRRYFNLFEKRIHKYFQPTKNVFIDSNDIIWMIHSNGEFGGIVQRFDTRKRKPINHKIKNFAYELVFPQSIFELDSNRMCITSGSQFDDDLGKIFMISNNCSSCIFDGSNIDNSIQLSATDTVDSINIVSSRFDNVCVGKGAYSSVDNSVYFASANSIQSIHLSDKNYIDYHKKISVLTDISNDITKSVYPEINVQKIIVSSSNKIILLTQHHGILIYQDNHFSVLA